MMMNQDLFDRINNAMMAHSMACGGDDNAFEALWTLGFMAGAIISRAPDQEAKHTAQQIFMDAMNSGLTVDLETIH